MAVSQVEENAQLLLLLILIQKNYFDQLHVRIENCAVQDNSPEFFQGGENGAAAIGVIVQGECAREPPPSDGVV